MGMIVLAGSVVATRRTRVRDIVLLRLVGATRGQVARRQLVEFALLSSGVALLAFAAGIGGAWLVDRPGVRHSRSSPIGRAAAR